MREPFRGVAAIETCCCLKEFAVGKFVALKSQENTSNWQGSRSLICAGTCWFRETVWNVTRLQVQVRFKNQALERHL